MICYTCLLLRNATLHPRVAMYHCTNRAARQTHFGVSPSPRLCMSALSPSLHTHNTQSLLSLFLHGAERREALKSWTNDVVTGPPAHILHLPLTMLPPSWFCTRLLRFPRHFSLSLSLFQNRNLVREPLCFGGLHTPGLQAFDLRAELTHEDDGRLLFVALRQTEREREGRRKTTEGERERKREKTRYIFAHSIGPQMAGGRLWQISLENRAKNALEDFGRCEINKLGRALIALLLFSTLSESECPSPYKSALVMEVFGSPSHI